MDLNKHTMKKLLALITFTVVLCAALMNFSALLTWMSFVISVLFPFLLGSAIAFCLNIPMRFFERKLFTERRGKKPGQKPSRIARPLSLILTLLCMVGIFALVIGVLFPQLASTFESVAAAMSAFLPKTQLWLEEIFAENKGIVEYISSIDLKQTDWSAWIGNIKDFAVNGAGNVLNYTINATVTVVSTTIHIFIAFIFSIYALIQKERLAASFTKLIRAVFQDQTVEKILHVCSLSHVTFSRFITGQCLEALILGGMFFVTMLIFRFPYALLIGVVIAFTALIPVVGAFVGFFVGFFLILMVNPMQAIAFAVLFFVLQQIEENLIYPHVVGNSIGLPSIWVLFAVMVGGSLMGVLGMLLFIPIMSVLYSLLRDWTNKRLQKKEAL